MTGRCILDGLELYLVAEEIKNDVRYLTGRLFPDKIIGIGNHLMKLHCL